MQGHRSEKISEVVARDILDDIVERDLPPGTMLPSENHMLAQFRVGRGSLREALRILEVHGLLRVKAGPRGGPVVDDVTSRDFGRTSTFYYHAKRTTLSHLLEARAVLEPIMTRMAAERADDEARDRLATNIQMCRELIDDPGPEWAMYSAEFHGLVAGMSGNPILDLMGSSLNDIHAERVRTIFPLSERPAVLEVHERIADAILAKDANEAERLASRHMDEFVRKVNELGPGMVDGPLGWH